MSSASRLLNEGLSTEALKILEIPDVSLSVEELQIKDYRYIGSYNWAEGSDENNPVLIVPGIDHKPPLVLKKSPPQWRERPLPFSVPPDTGEHFRDRNGHIVPGRPLLPLVAAVNEQNVQPPIDWPNVDIVTDRNSLRKLLRWVRGTGRDWRIDTELVGKKTTFLNRWEQQTVDNLNGTMYGFGFEKAFTRTVPGSDGLPGHARIATYDFGGLRVVLQFEVDAYFPGSDSDTRESEDATEPSLTETTSTISLSIGEPKTSFGLGIISRGKSNIPDSAIIEVAATTRKLDWKERYPQLFFSQTPHHFLAWHDQLRLGTFIRIDRRTIDCPLLQAANERLQPTFKKLRDVLKVIQDIVTQHGQDERLTLLCTNKRLEIYKRGDKTSCLPKEASALFQPEDRD